MNEHVIANTIVEERTVRRPDESKRLSFGIRSLDDALGGIFPGDLVLIGAPPGAGKTNLACTITMRNADANRRILFAALEAEEFEIERRIKYPLVMQARKSKEYIPFDRWYRGDFLDELTEEEEAVEKFMASAYSNVKIKYRGREDFNEESLVNLMLEHGQEIDLMIVDHVHYFDFDGDNENRALKSIAKTARSLAIDFGVPIVLIAHLRKRDRFNDEICAGMDEFHGSSDLAKIATKVITLSPGEMIRAKTGEILFETFFRTPKNRFNASATRFVTKNYFDPQRGVYHDRYKIGWAKQKRDEEFEQLENSSRPYWYTEGGGCGVDDAPTKQNVFTPPRRTPAVARSPHAD